MIVFFPYKKRIRSISPCDTGTGFAVTFSLRDKKVRPQRNAAVAVSEENKRGNLYLSSDVLSSEDFLYGGCHFVGSFLFLRFRKIEMAAGVAGDHFRSLLSNFCSHPRSSVRDGPARFPPVRRFFRRHNPTPAAPARFCPAARLFPPCRREGMAAGQSRPLACAAPFCPPHPSVARLVVPAFARVPLRCGRGCCWPMPCAGRRAGAPS